MEQFWAMVRSAYTKTHHQRSHKGAEFCINGRAFCQNDRRVWQEERVTNFVHQGMAGKTPYKSRVAS